MVILDSKSKIPVERVLDPVDLHFVSGIGKPLAVRFSLISEGVIFCCKDQCLWLIRKIPLP